MKIHLRAFLLVLMALSFASITVAEEAEFHCEVLAIQGEVRVTGADGASRDAKEGDRLSKGETIAVGDESFADISYDRDWKNITRLEEGTTVKLASVVPARLDLRKGSVFSKLKSIPRDSQFEIRTPTAVATVRGTEYRTSFLDGTTDVANVSSSKVFVYGVDADGNADNENELVLEQNMKTVVEAIGQPPAEPASIPASEIKEVKSIQNSIEKAVKKAESDGRESTIQSVAEIEEVIEELKKPRVLAPANPTDLSRVTDNRRRAFGGGDRVMAPPAVPESATEAPPAQAPQESKDAAE